MKTTPKHEVIDSNTYYGQQSATWTEIRLYTSPFSVSRIQVVVKKDFYDYQSYATVSAWSSSSGWLLIAKHGLDEHPAAKAWYKQCEKNEALFSATAEALFRIGEDFHA